MCLFSRVAPSAMQTRSPTTEPVSTAWSPTLEVRATTESVRQDPRPTYTALQTIVLSSRQPRSNTQLSPTTSGPRKTTSSSTQQSFPIMTGGTISRRGPRTSLLPGQHHPSLPQKCAGQHPDPEHESCPAYTRSGSQYRSRRWELRARRRADRPPIGREAPDCQSHRKTPLGCAGISPVRTHRYRCCRDEIVLVPAAVSPGTQ